jgi:serine/threonine protein kinase
MNVVKLFGICREPLAILTEFIAGGSLEEHMLGDKTVRVTALDVLLWMRDICAGLNHLHENNVLHR